MSQKPKVRNIGDRFVRRERYIEGVRLTAMVVAPNGTEQPSAPSRHSYTEARDDMLAALEMDRADEKQRAITSQPAPKTVRPTTRLSRKENRCPQNT